MQKAWYEGLGRPPVEFESYEPYVIDDGKKLNGVVQVMQALFMQRRLSADDMRDMAQTLEAALQEFIPLDEE